MSQSRFRTLAAALLAGVLMSIPIVAAADSLESEIELLRSDLKTAKVEIVKEALKVEGPKADAFWPVYRKYQLELDAIGDKRLAVIKDYAAHMDSLTDEKAKSIVKQSLDLQSARTALLKKYYKEFDKVLGAVDAAKLIQVEHLVQSLVDLQVAANMPLIGKPASSTP